MMNLERSVTCVYQIVYGGKDEYSMKAYRVPPANVPKERYQPNENENKIRTDALTKTDYSSLENDATLHTTHLNLRKMNQLQATLPRTWDNSRIIRRSKSDNNPIANEKKLGNKIKTSVCNEESVATRTFNIQKMGNTTKKYVTDDSINIVERAQTLNSLDFKMYKCGNAADRKSDISNDERPFLPYLDQTNFHVNPEESFSDSSPDNINDHSFDYDFQMKNIENRLNMYNAPNTLECLAISSNKKRNDRTSLVLKKQTLNLYQDQREPEKKINGRKIKYSDIKQSTGYELYPAHTVIMESITAYDEKLCFADLEKKMKQQIPFPQTFEQFGDRNGALFKGCLNDSSQTLMKVNHINPLDKGGDYFLREMSKVNSPEQYDDVVVKQTYADSVEKIHSRTSLTISKTINKASSLSKQYDNELGEWSYTRLPVLSPENKLLGDRPPSSDIIMFIDQDNESSRELGKKQHQLDTSKLKPVKSKKRSRGRRHASPLFLREEERLSIQLGGHSPKLQKPSKITFELQQEDPVFEDTTLSTINASFSECVEKCVEFNSIEGSFEDDTLYNVVENHHVVSDNSVILHDVTNQDVTLEELNNFTNGETSFQTETPEATPNISLIANLNESTFDVDEEVSCSVNFDLGENASNFKVEPDLIKEYKLAKDIINPPGKWMKDSQQQELSRQQESIPRKRNSLTVLKTSPREQYAFAREKEMQSIQDEEMEIHQSGITHQYDRFQNQSGITQGQHDKLPRQQVKSSRQQDNLPKSQNTSTLQHDTSPRQHQNEPPNLHDKSSKQQDKSQEQHEEMTENKSMLVHQSDSQPSQQTTSQGQHDESSSQTSDEQTVIHYNVSTKTRRSTLSFCDPNSYSGTPTSAENMFSNGDDVTLDSQSKSQEIEDTESTSRVVYDTENRSRNVEDTESKPQEIEDTESKSREVEDTESKCREVEANESKCREVEDTESNSREVEDTITVTTCLELLPVTLRGILTNGLKNTGLIEQQNREECKIDSTFNKCIRSQNSLYDGCREHPTAISDPKGYPPAVGYNTMYQTNVGDHAKYQTEDYSNPEYKNPTYPTAEYPNTEYLLEDYPTTEYRYPITGDDNEDQHIEYSQDVNATEQIERASPSTLLQNEYNTLANEQNHIMQQYGQDANELHTDRSQLDQGDEAYITTTGQSGLNSEIFSAIPTSHSLNTSADLHQAMEHVRVMDRRRTWTNATHPVKRTPMYPNQFVNGQKESRPKYLHMMGRLKRHSFEAWDKQYGPYQKQPMEGNKSDNHIRYCMTGNTKTSTRNNDVASCTCRTCLSTAQWVQGMAGVDVRLPQLRV